MASQPGAADFYWAPDFTDLHGFANVHHGFLCIAIGKESITIRRTAIPSMLVNFSTFAFLLNFSFMK